MAGFEIIGLLGVMIIFISYGMLQTSRISVEGIGYSLLNAVGALLIIYSLLHEFNLPAFVIEVGWLLLSVYGVFVRLRKK